MKVKLTAGVKLLANGASNKEDSPLMRGVHITKDKAVVADGSLLVIKSLQVNEMDFAPTFEDGIDDIIVPAEALKACKGDEIGLQTIEAMRSVPKEHLLDPDASETVTKVVARLDGEDYSVEVDAIDGDYPNHVALFKPSPFVGQIAISTNVLKKLFKALPNDSIVKLRISEPDKPVEFQCTDPDGDLPLRGLVMPLATSWLNTTWRTEELDEGS